MSMMKIEPVAALICTLLWLSACSPQPSQTETRRVTEGDAIADAPPCTPVSDQQRPRVDAALRVLMEFHDYDDVYDGAMMFFGRRRSLEDQEPFCLDEALKRDITTATLAAKTWDRGLAGIAKLELARQLGPRDGRIVRYVAQTAFYGQPVADIGFSDLRPQARSVLASFGVAAAPWREAALGSMDAKTSLGTTSAQVAAASRQPAAVTAVADLLAQELSRAHGVIGREHAKRLVELAYGLGAAGEAARPHIKLLTRLLDRKVQSSAPPFGVIERSPSEVCRAIAWVGGPEADRTLASAKCAERPWPLLPQ
jgi:hypothetical protein